MNHFKLAFLIFFICIEKQILFAQSKAVNRDKYLIHVARTDEEINIDGLLDEEVWQIAEKADSLHRVTPTDTGYAIGQTTVMTTHDKSNLYVAAICYDPTPGKRPVLSLRRDFSWWGNDQFNLFLDTYNDYTNGYAFYVSAAGVQADGLISDGNSVNWTWDAKWKAAIESYKDYWVIEYGIPLRSLRYFGGDTAWGVNFGRMDYKTNEKSSWAPMPRQFFHCDPAFMGTLLWDQPLEKSGLRFSLIPYVKGKIIRDNQVEKDTKWNGGAGFDSKIMLSTSLNLDITVNPDYSQVEEDQQQTNLDRFELFFPERRQFFLENSDLFAELGSREVRPFFSRRIGLQVPVHAGFRLSGKLGNKWRIGLMDMQTGKKEEIPSANFAVAVLQRQVFSRSYISGFVINKQITGDDIDSLYSGMDYNRIVGLEYNLASPDAKWTGKAFYHYSFYPHSSGSVSIFAGDLLYSTRYFKASMAATRVGSDYISEIGYIRRAGYLSLNPSTGFTFYPSASIVVSHGPNLNFSILFDPGFQKMTDRTTQLSYLFSFRNTSKLTLSFSDEYVLLDRPYDPTNNNGEKLPAGESFDWQNVQVSYASDFRDLFTCSANVAFGSYYNGTRLNLSGSVGYRVQPYGSLSISANYNKISLPDPYNSAELVLIGPKLDVTFTDKVFLTAFLQYNNQIDNLNTNIRFQWRFAPVSDLYIVYTDNAFADGFTNKNRGLVVKLSYYFN